MRDGGDFLRPYLHHARLRLGLRHPGFGSHRPVLTLFSSAFLLGLVLIAAPGPVFAESLRQSVRGGFRPALAVQLGSLTGDALWAVLGLAGVGLLLRVEALRLPIGLAGVSYLLWLSWESWRAASRELDLGSETSLAWRGALKAGIVLSITNPQNLAYWAALGSALGAVGIHDPAPAHYAVFFAGFMAAAVVWAFFCAAVLDRLFRKAGARWARLTYRLCAVAFLALALAALRELVRSPSPAEAPKPEPAGVSGVEVGGVEGRGRSGGPPGPPTASMARGLVGPVVCSTHEGTRRR